MIRLTSQPPYCIKCEIQLKLGTPCFYRHDLIIFNHFPKILIDKKKKPEEKNYKLGNYLEGKKNFCIHP